MLSLDALTTRLNQGISLGVEDVAQAALVLESPGDDQTKANFLTALSRKGETAEEVTYFAKEFRARAIDPHVSAFSAHAIDIVGTGGDHAGGFNISSLVVLVLASAGVPVMKHGNRGITSKCGSADLIGALGFKLDASNDHLNKALKELGYAFFFAPQFNPAFKHIVPVRKFLATQGQRTIFNILGPLINPGRPAHIMLGVYALSWVDKLSEALNALGMSAGLVVHGALKDGQGTDELTTASTNHVKGVGRLKELNAIWDAHTFDLKKSDFEELKGSDLKTNLTLVDALLAGKAPEGLVDTIALNASLGLWIVGKTAEPKEGFSFAKELLLGGAVKEKIVSTRDFFASL
jgi:anthranilate phosphoribosyltransferase